MSAPAAAAMAATSSALKAATGIPSFRYLSAWFCPYAHRATIALEHHKDRVHYDWVEVRHEQSETKQKQKKGCRISVYLLFFIVCHSAPTHVFIV